MFPFAVSITGEPNVSVSASISETHANMLYTKWSINDEEDFSEFKFAHYGSFIAIGAFRYVVLIDMCGFLCTTAVGISYRTGA